MDMAPIAKPKPVLERTFIREWRLFRQKEAENKSDYTMEAIAPLANMSRSNLNKIELGETPYQQQHLEALAKIYACSAADLVARDPNDRSSVWAVADLLKKIPADQVRIIYGLAESMIRERNPVSS